jgi:hypothetical protein
MRSRTVHQREAGRQREYAKYLVRYKRWKLDGFDPKIRRATGAVPTNTKASEGVLSPRAFLGLPRNHIPDVNLLRVSGWLDLR